MPLEGLSSNTQLTANRMWGIIIGTIEMMRKENFKGISVLVLRYAKSIANSVATAAEPMVKKTVFINIFPKDGSE